MHRRFEFAFHACAGGRDPEDDATLALLGSMGWEIRGVTYSPDGELVVALQRHLDESHPLPEPSELAATLESPLHVPAPEDFDTV